jgi:5-oxoprolinase (ATP-hydrolysing)
MWIDTGGTFTDAVARGPDGLLRRTKVLSTGELRGRIARMLDSRRILVEQDWGGVEGLLVGMQLSTIGGDDPRVVAGHERTGGGWVLEVEDALPRGIEAGETFTVAGDEPAPLLAARILTGVAGPPAPLPPLEMRLATTRGTNALLTRSGARVALLVTEGFADLLEIGTQQRPDLFALRVEKPRGLYETVVEVRERLAADGTVLRELDEAGVDREGRRLVEQGIECAAVALMHADRFPAQERRVGELLRGAGMRHICLSSDVAPFIKIVTRAQTAVVEAYLAPVIEEYVGSIERALEAGRRTADTEPTQSRRRGRLRLLTSVGGLVGAAGFRAKDSLLSGPAGGVIGARAAALRSEVRKAISFDMGGTSTDVARLDIGAEGGGGLDYVYEHSVGDATLASPAVAVESVAAGGGSVCGFDGIRLFVGPRSAAASPGPACYGAGGPLTLTDVNLLLGRLDPERLPIPVSEEAARAALADVKRAMADAPGAAAIDDDRLLAGFLDIAAERMAGAIRRVSSRAGYDPREYTLVSFGGAGGQHACAVAEKLGIRAVLVPADTGVLSAVGLGAAAVERMAERQVLRPLRTVAGELSRVLLALEDEATRAVKQEDPGPGAAVRRRIAAMRLAGQESTVEVDLRTDRDEAELFVERYEAMYGHRPAIDARDIELVWVRVIAASSSEGASAEPEPVGRSAAGAPESMRKAWIGGARREARIYERGSLGAGTTIAGPALVYEQHTMVIVEQGWRAEVDREGALVLRRPVAEREVKAEEDIGARGVEASRISAESRPILDQVRLEVLASRLESIAKEMGEALRRTAVSTNVKERLDYSCALLDAEGELIVNAPHVPVHLGSLGLCVRTVREAIDIGLGDTVVTNHPASGGSHLPDITVITAVHGSGGLIGYAASRAHHAEIGGTRPGSMPPNATGLGEEGVVIPPMYLIRAGEGRYEDMRRLLLSGPYPTRAIEDNLADLRAAAAANHRASEALRDLVQAEGAACVRAAMEAIKDRGERAIRRALGALSRGRTVAVETMDDGSPLHAAVEISVDSATIDFAGSAGVHAGNLNATPAIVRSAVMYVLRLLVDEEIPLNEGLMRAVRVLLPLGMLNPPFGDDPFRAPAVAGGNVETSQRLVDTLLKALGVCACSQGTMNNVLFGNDRFSYYETVCGGCGAGPGFDGASAIHSHMTNTRITDPEILETRCPVRLERFAVRHGSGGRGRWRGGDGVVRQILFLTPASVSVLTQHRREGPYGCAGGEPGRPGRQRLVLANGQIHDLGAFDGAEVAAGDRLVLETPGGGGWGAPQ